QPRWTFIGHAEVPAGVVVRLTQMARPNPPVLAHLHRPAAAWARRPLDAAHDRALGWPRVFPPSPLLLAHAVALRRAFNRSDMACRFGSFTGAFSKSAARNRRLMRASKHPTQRTVCPGASCQRLSRPAHARCHTWPLTM